MCVIVWSGTSGAVPVVPDGEGPGHSQEGGRDCFIFGAGQACSFVSPIVRSTEHSFNFPRSILDYSVSLSSFYLPTCAPPLARFLLVATPTPSCLTNP